MKKPQRQKKVIKWMLISIAYSIAIFFPYAIACVAYQVAAIRLDLAKTLAALPIVPLWLPLVPQGKLGDIPAVFPVILGSAIIGMLIINRARHHLARLGEENRARDMQDI